MNNPLFPVFLKLDQQLPVLVIGGGNVALEKLRALLDNCPGAAIRLVGASVRDEVRALARANNIPVGERAFTPADLNGIRIVLAAVNNRETSREICRECRERNILINVADTPDLCDFYLGSVVTKGQLRIGISTNGKSPTIAKRVKETLDDAFPVEINSLLENMAKIRGSLSGSFTEKVKELNELTAKLAPRGKR
jgi:siroheme synthase-like protein